MTETVPPTLSSETPALLRSPVFIAAVLLSVFVAGGMTFITLTRTSSVADTPDPISNYIPGAPVDQERAFQALDELSDPNTQKLLANTTLRTTYSGILATSREVESSGPDSIALILELESGIEETVAFQFNESELEVIEWFDVTPTGSNSINYSELQLEPENGVSITKITNLTDPALLPAGEASHRYIIEITKQDWQR